MVKMSLHKNVECFRSTLLLLLTPQCYSSLCLDGEIGLINK